MGSFVEKPLVYVAGPYIHPDPVENTHNTIEAAEILHNTGWFTAYVPHLSLLWHVVAPHTADYWYAYDLAILKRCDALLRRPGQSMGADNEVTFANDHDIPVFYDNGSLYKWYQDTASLYSWYKERE
jgi:hypothetical protein